MVKHTHTFYFEEDDKLEFAALYDAMMKKGTRRVEGMKCWRFIRDKAKLPDGFTAKDTTHEISWKSKINPAIILECEIEEKI